MDRSGALYGWPMKPLASMLLSTWVGTRVAAVVARPAVSGTQFAGFFSVNSSSCFPVKLLSSWQYSVSALTCVSDHGSVTTLCLPVKCVHLCEQHRERHTVAA